MTAVIILVVIAAAAVGITLQSKSRGTKDIREMGGMEEVFEPLIAHIRSLNPENSKIIRLEPLRIDIEIQADFTYSLFSINYYDHNTYAVFMMVTSKMSGQEVKEKWKCNLMEGQDFVWERIMADIEVILSDFK